MTVPLTGPNGEPVEAVWVVGGPIPITTPIDVNIVSPLDGSGFVNVDIAAQSLAELNVNVAQWAGTAVAKGAGSSSNGTLRVTPSGAATGTGSSVAASATVVTLLASNVNRRGATIYNDSTAVLKVMLGSGASATLFAVAMAANSYYEVPFGYNGVITGIWASATGNARVVEIT